MSKLKELKISMPAMVGCRSFSSGQLLSTSENNCVSEASSGSRLKVVGFIRKPCHSKNYPLSFIGNMDKTPLWLEKP